MTQLLPPEAHLLVVLGEVRGDVKGILRTQHDMHSELKALEVRLGKKLDTIENRVSALENENAGPRLTKVETKTTSLEHYRIKIAGFTIGLAMFLSLTKEKLPGFFAFFTGG